MVDCQGSRIQIVAIYHYSEQMGNGNEIYSASYPIKESDWYYPPLNSLSEKSLKVVCATNRNPKSELTPKPLHLTESDIAEENRKIEEEKRQLAEERRKLEEEKRKFNTKPPINTPQDIKRQRCINLGLAPNSADFQQCMN